MRNILLLYLILLVQFSTAQIVNIPDSLFKNYLINVPGLDLNEDGEIQIEEAQQPNIFQLGVRNLGITDLTGIEAFTSLKLFDCSDNPISSVDFSNNIELGNLDISACPISEIDLSNLLELGSLIAQQCSLEVLDVSHNTDLTLLTINSNKITELDVSNNPNLRILRAGNNNISNIDISTNDMLERIDLSRNILSELDLSNLDKVSELIIHTNQITVLDIPHMVDLVNLSCQGNLIEFMNIENSDSLIILSASRNQLTELDLSDKPNLIRVSFADNSISEIDVKSSVNLERLKFENNLIKEIDISNNVNLTLFESINNLYKVVDASANSLLTSFTASGPNLRYINLANGANENISLMQGLGDELECIRVDDDFDFDNIPISWNKSANTIYTNECCLNNEVLYNTNICNGESFISPSGNLIITEPGNYLDTLENCFGCDSIINLNISISSINTELIITDSTLTAVESDMSYEWLDCNTLVVIEGATDTIFIPEETGNYAVVITNNFGCIDTSECAIIDIISSNIDIDLIQNIEIFPNPTFDKIHVTQEGVSSKLEFRIFDPFGCFVNIRKHENNGLHTIELPALAGVYILQIWGDGKLLKTQKIVRLIP